MICFCDARKCRNNPMDGAWEYDRTTLALTRLELHNKLVHNDSMKIKQTRSGAYVLVAR